MDLGQVKIKDEDSLKQAQHRKEERSERIKTENQSKNSIASVIKIIGWIMVAITVITGTNFALQHNMLGYAYLFSGIVGGVILIGFSEVINLLQKIYVNTRK